MARGMWNIWNNPILPIYRKKGEEVAAQLAQEATLLRKYSGREFKNFKIAICTPLLISSPLLS